MTYQDAVDLAICKKAFLMSNTTSEYQNKVNKFAKLNFFLIKFIILIKFVVVETYEFLITNKSVQHQGMLEFINLLILEFILLHSSLEW